MENRRFLPYIVLSAVLLFSGLSCGGNKGPEAPESADSFAYEKEYDRGPLKFYVKLDRDSITLAEDINLRLEVVADKGYEVNFPDVSSSVGEFVMSDFRILNPKLIDDKTVLSVRTYELEPFLSGEYSIPPLVFKYWELSDENRENVHTLETEAVSVKVESILPEDKEAWQLKDVPDVASPPAANYTLIILLAAAALLVAGGTVLGIFLYRRARDRRLAESLITPHELALEQLRRMVEMHYVESGAVKLFYSVLSNILRHYIENRFSIRAAEQTTEEFLRSLRHSGLLEDSHKQVLAAFLNHSDLVKFAEHSASMEEIQKSFNVCRDFITATTDEEVKIQAPGSSAYVMPPCPDSGEAVSAASDVAPEESAAGEIVSHEGDKQDV